MFNYTLLSNQIQDCFNDFSKSLIDGLGVVDKKFIYCMLNGIIKSNSCHLTKIGRCLHEDITLKKTEERLSRNLMSFDELDTVHLNYTNYIKLSNMVSSNSIFYVDESDLAKPNVKSFESLGDVQDGSKEHTWTKGYGITEITTLYNDEPIIMQSKLWSTADKSFISKNKYLYELLDNNFKTFKGSTYVFDRGFDNTDLIKKIINSDNHFIIRLKQNRKYLINNKKYTVEEISNKRKGKVFLKTYSSKGLITNRLSYVKVNLLGINKPLNLIISYSDNNFELCYLLTDIEINNAHDLKVVTRTYFKRWKIEEFFRFKKQQYNFEDIRVRSINALRVINSLINYIITFISMHTIRNAWLNREIIKISKPIKTRVFFNYYRLIMGIKMIFDNVIYKVKTYIDNNIRNINYILKKKSKQLTLFNFDVF